MLFSRRLMLAANLAATLAVPFAAGARASI
jgi:hypothetical protein